MYIDTSCLAAYYLPKPNSEAVQEILLREDRIVISHLTEIELLSALKKKHRIGELLKKMATGPCNCSRNIAVPYSVEIAKIGLGVFKSAEWLLETTSNSLRTLDAIHLGVAHNYGFELYTFDQTLIEAAKEFNIGTVS